MCKSVSRNLKMLCDLTWDTYYMTSLQMICNLERLERSCIYSCSTMLWLSNLTWLICKASKIVPQPSWNSQISTSLSLMLELWLVQNSTQSMALSFKWVGLFTTAIQEVMQSEANPSTSHSQHRCPELPFPIRICMFVIQKSKILARSTNEILLSFCRDILQWEKGSVLL